ncbi:MAG TPA: thiamine pyrophosphate-binding protein [Drouetiella sp.]
MPEYLASHLLLDQLSSEGTRFIFGSLSSADSPLIGAAFDLNTDIHYLAAMHEEIAGSMAIGYAQASGRPGVVSLPAATGLINSLSSLYNASHARVPMIVLADQQDTRILNDEPPLWGDLCELARPVSKWVCELRTASEIPRLIRRAFHEANSPPKGPVFMSLPINLLLEPTNVRTIRPPQTSPLGAADQGFLRKAAKALVSAKRPCIIVGNEVSAYKARKEVVTLAEVIGCPVFCEPMPTGVNFPNRHPQFGGVLPLNLSKASATLQSFDCVLVIGMQTRLPAKTEDPPLIKPGIYVIQLNVEPGLSGRSLPCDLTTNADIGESLSRLRADIQLIVDSTWVTSAKMRASQTISTISKIREQQEEQSGYPREDSRITLSWLLRLLDAVRPESSVIVNDLVSEKADPFETLSLENSSSYFGSNGGIAGHGPAAALGVQWASPESTVVCLTSDESILYYPQALWTAAHYGLHVKFIVVNSLGRTNYNVRLTPSVRSEARIFLDNPPLAFTELSRAMRVPGNTVSVMSDLEEALNQMFESPGPFLLDVHIDENAT